MSEQLRFDGKVVLVTGAGQGLGRSHALAFASRGAKVVVNDLGGSAHGGGKSSAAADQVVAQIRAAGGEAVANYDSVENGDLIVKTAIDAFGRIDVVVNNAGILRDTSFPKMTDEDWEIIFRVHVLGAFRVTHAAWPHMRDQGYGRILFTSSAAGIYGNFGQANYSAAKLGLVGFASTLALEGSKRNIRVNTVAPLAGSRLTETVMPKEVVDALKPEYVSPVVLFLCHERSQETGGLFEVGGGFCAKLRFARTPGKTWKLGRNLSPEDIQKAWGVITNFDGATHPENITASMQPVLSNLQSKSRGGNDLIDLDEALGYEMTPQTNSYDERDLAIYALGVGAGKKPTDEKELRFVYENNPGGFDPLPTFAVVPALKVIFKLAAEGKTAPGLNYGLDRVLHAEQYTELLRPWPTKANLRHTARVSEIYDKGRHALVVTHLDTFDAGSGELLAKNDITTFVRGAGGFGGERGPSGDSNTPPDRAPDFVVEDRIDEEQALLYRLSGDWNPLHADPAFATAFGFPKPILHGLCSFGYVGRHAVTHFLNGDPRFFKSIRVRFTDVVFPGETLKIEYWKESDTRLLARATVVERQKVVLSNVAIELWKELPKPKAAAKPAQKAEQAATVDPASVLQSSDVFVAIRDYIADTPDLCKQIATSFQFKLQNPESAYNIDLKNAPGAMSVGVKDADCTLSMLDSDFLEMVTGKANPQKLFMSGKLKISGNIMASQKLEFLMKMDKKRVEKVVLARLSGTGAAPAAAPAPAPAAPVAPPKVALAPALVSALKDRLKQNPSLVAGLPAPVQFALQAPEAFFAVSPNGDVHEGRIDGAGATFGLADEDFAAWCSGQTDARSLYMHGKLTVAGDIKLAHHLGFLKS